MSNVVKFKQLSERTLFFNILLSLLISTGVPYNLKTVLEKKFNINCNMFGV